MDLLQLKHIIFLRFVECQKQLVFQPTDAIQVFGQLGFGCLLNCQLPFVLVQKKTRSCPFHLLYELLARKVSVQFLLPG